MTPLTYSKLCATRVIRITVYVYQSSFESKRGATIAETISGDDLDILIAFETERGDIRIKLVLDIQIFDCVTQHRTSKEQQVVAIYLLKHCSNRCHW